MTIKKVGSGDNDFNFLSNRVNFSNNINKNKFTSTQKVSANLNSKSGSNTTKIEVAGFNSQNKTSNSSTNKVDPSKGYHKVDLIGGYSVQVPNDTSWMNTPLKDENIISEKEESHVNGTEKTKEYDDGTIVKEYYHYKGSVRQETRYSGDPDNPEEGDLKNTKTEYTGEDGKVIHNDTRVWANIPGIGSGWYTDLVSRSTDWLVFDKEGNEIPFDINPNSEYQQIRQKSMLIPPPSEGFFDID